MNKTYDWIKEFHDDNQRTQESLAAISNDYNYTVELFFGGYFLRSQEKTTNTKTQKGTKK